MDLPQRMPAVEHSDLSSVPETMFCGGQGSFYSGCPLATTKSTCHVQEINNLIKF